MIVFFVFLVTAFIVTLYFSIRKIDPSLERVVLDHVTLSGKLYDSFMKFIHSGELVIPKGLFISNGHVWYKFLSEGEVRIGIDDFLLKLLGDIDRIKLNSSRESINKRGRMCVIKQSRKRLRLISPIEGTITKVNKDLMKNVELIKEDPYQKGWLYIIKPAVDVSHIKQEMEAAVFTQDWIHREIEKLSDFFVHEFPSKSDLEEMLRKEKIPLVGILKNMDGLAWQKFQENFLR